MALPALDPVAWLTLQPLGERVPVHAGQSLLEAALAAGLDLPRSCRNGTCRTCLCRLVQGDIRWRIDWPGLSPDEKREGWILPCVASACSDLVLESTPVRWDQA